MTDPKPKPATDEEIARGHDDYDYHPAYEAFVERLIARIDAEKAALNNVVRDLGEATKRIAELEAALNNLIAAHDAPLGAVAMVQLATKRAREALGDDAT